RARHVLPRSHVGEDLGLPGWIAATPTAAVMAPVGADEQVILAHVLRQVRQGLPLLLGRVETVFLEELWSPHVRTAAQDAPPGVEHVGHPGRSRLDEANRRSGKSSGILLATRFLKAISGSVRVWGRV